MQRLQSLRQQRCHRYRIGTVGNAVGAPDFARACFMNDLQRVVGKQGVCYRDIDVCGAGLQDQPSRLGNRATSAGDVVKQHHVASGQRDAG